MKPRRQQAVRMTSAGDIAGPLFLWLLVWLIIVGVPGYAVYRLLEWVLHVALT